MPSSPSDKLYFADFDEPEFAAKVLAKIESAEKDKFTSEVRARVAKAFKYYYGYDLDGTHGVSGITRGGEQGELAVYRVNHSRALVGTLLNLVTSQKVVWVPKATNIDYESLKQVEIAKSLLEYIWVERNVERLVNSMVEGAIVFGEGFVLGLWADDAGEDVGMDPESDPENPKPVRSGDFVFQNVSTWQVTRDRCKHSWDELDWVIVTIWRNKYDLLAQYPAYAKEIFAAPVESQSNSRPSTNQHTESDDIPVHIFFHKPTPALPYGREAWILADKTILRDGRLSYDEIPLARVVPSEMTGTPYGYTQFFEILAIQELIDSLHSTAASNLTTFGTQNIFLPHQSEIQNAQVGGGLRIIQGGPDDKEPKALELCRTPPELYKHIEDLKRDQETLFGVNAVVRGQTEGGKDLSGAAMALLETQAKQQSSGLHASFRQAVQKLGLFVITESRKRCTTPRKVSLVGKDNSFLISETEYTGESFGAIKRVLIDLGNPLSQNVFGRTEMATDLMNKGLINNLEQYFLVLDTGRAEPITQGITNELLLIKSENEDIASGIVPESMLHDNHLLHGREHRVPVASPQARKNPEVLKAHVQHMARHYEAYFGVAPMQPVLDPMTGMPAVDPTTGQPFPPSPEPMYRQRMLILMGMAPPDPMMGGMPMGGDPASGMSGGAPQMLAPQDPGQNTPAAPGKEFGNAETAKPSELPSLPTNPSTGSQWSPADGTQQ